MPELAEVKIMSDFINKISDGVAFSYMEKSPETKVDTQNLSTSAEFSIEAVSRGKELKLIFPEWDEDLLFTMGMSGNWIAGLLKNGIPKHTHLRFFGTMKDGAEMFLGMNDVRRFAKWKWVEKDTWGKNRGPCVLTEHEKWKEHLNTNLFLGKAVFVSKPIYEAMMDQKFFNGIGNYLRAWIIGELDVNPKLTLYEFYKQEQGFERLCSKTLEIVQSSYIMGGGQLKDWTNPNGAEPFKILHYGDAINSKAIRDRQGRAFWFKNKWSNVMLT